MVNFNTKEKGCFILGISPLASLISKTLSAKNFRFFLVKELTNFTTTTILEVESLKPIPVHTWDAFVEVTEPRALS
jgi:hypothetical protein